MTQSDPKQFTLHMIGNAHLDPVWLWDWREGRQEALDTCWAAVDRLRETPDFVFTRSSAAIYRWIEEDDPALFAEIRRYVAEGRWEIVGGWWEQPDCNLPGGESFVRQALYGQAYFREKFGVEASVGYNVDSFGHNAGLPQILAKSGLDCYVFCRPDPAEKYLPGLLFHWEGPDGSRVLAYRPYGHYTGDLGPRVFACVEVLTAYAESATPLRDLALLYGVGNHGGGPTQEALATLQRLDANPALPRVKFSRLDRFFARVREQCHDFPVVTGDLQYHSRGCFTSLSRVKWYNRRSEMALMTAERLATLLERLGMLVWPDARTAEAWSKVLFNQFHDILAGTSLQRAYEDLYAWYEEALATAREATSTALEALALRVETGAAQEPVLVVNPLPWVRTEAVQLAPDQAPRLVSVPALGWTVVDAAAPEPAPAQPVSVAPDRLENEFLRAILGPGGVVTSLVDKRSGRELLAAPAHRLLVIDDPWDTWAHGAEAFREVLGEMAPQGEPRVTQAGPARGAVEFRLGWGDSTATVEVSLNAGRPQLDFALAVDWHERLRMLKVAFPLALENPVATFEHSYAALALPADGSERPAQHWVDVTGQQEGQTAGAALLNDCKYGFDVLEAELRMTILRSPAYAWHAPTALDPSQHHEYLDQGEVRVGYALLPHGGGWEDAAVPPAGWALNNPLLAAPTTATEAPTLPASGSLAEVGPANVVGTVFKPAQDGSGLVARVYETTGRATRARLALPQEGRSWEFEIAAWEIKTLRLPGLGETGDPVELDLLERPM